jgi:hypothetical protein
VTVHAIRRLSEAEAQFRQNTAFVSNGSAGTDGTLPAKLPAAPATSITPIDAKAVWDAMEQPTSRRVAVALSRSGRKVSHATISAWRRRNWSVGDPLKFQESNFNAAMSLAWAEGDLAAVEQELTHRMELMNDEQLLRFTYRNILMAASRAALAIGRNADKLAVENPGGMGSGIQRIGAVIPAAIAGINRIELMDQRATQAKGAAAP